MKLSRKCHWFAKDTLETFAKVAMKMHLKITMEMRTSGISPIKQEAVAQTKSANHQWHRMKFSKEQVVSIEWYKEKKNPKYKTPFHIYFTKSTVTNHFFLSSRSVWMNYTRGRIHNGWDIGVTYQHFDAKLCITEIWWVPPPIKFSQGLVVQPSKEINGADRRILAGL